MREGLLPDGDVMGVDVRLEEVEVTGVDVADAMASKLPWGLGKNS